MPELPRKLARWLERGESLPHLRPAIAELLELAKDAGADIDMLLPPLSCDPALVAFILRQANSPAIGLSGKVTTVQLATSLLGVEELKRIVLSRFLSSASEHGPLSRALMRRGFWRHSVACANAAWAIASAVAPYEKEECYLAGLLHDVGWLVLGACFPDELERILSLADEGVERRDLELRMLGVRHADAGAELARRWRFPVMITDVIEFHHAPAHAKRHPVICDVACLAEAFAVRLGHGFDTHEEEPDPFATFSYRRLSENIGQHRMPSREDLTEAAEAAIQDLSRTPAGV